LRVFSDQFPIANKVKLAPLLYKYSFHAPSISTLAKPGQFIQIKTSKDYFPLWPRPFSIFDTDPKTGMLSIIFKQFGCGTSQLADMDIGDSLQLLGPLGNGFDIPNTKNDIIMAAGGVGLPPLYMLSKWAINSGISKSKITFISGAKTKDELFDDASLDSLGVNLEICTDDGSKGLKGTVVDILEKEIEKNNSPLVYSCGPEKMLERVDALIIKNNLHGFLSLEQLMPCGYGICSGCAIKVVPPDRHGPTDDNRDYHLKRVCKEGPVFKAGEVIWE